MRRVFFDFDLYKWLVVVVWRGRLGLKSHLSNLFSVLLWLFNLVDTGVAEGRRNCPARLLHLLLDFISLASFLKLLIEDPLTDLVDHVHDLRVGSLD